MPYMLEGRMIGHLWVHHGVIGLRCAAVLASFVRSVFIIFIIIVRACMLIRKVLWSLVFVRAAILHSISTCFHPVSMSDIRIGTSRLYR